MNEHFTINAGKSTTNVSEANDEISYMALSASLTMDLFEEGFFEIKNDSKLLCYTDGLIEMTIKQEVSSTQKAVEKCFCNSKNIKESFSNMLEKMQIDKSNPSIFDDVTMLGFDFNLNK